ncbi:MAG: hypothetical protein MRY79_07665, partial [Alphaproteobacteria bacterium]|nr:hypothetical protein [Alphaproteobacteria bacterium]
DSLDQDAYDAVFSQHTPAEVHYDDGFDAFEVDTDLYKESQLVRARIEINMKGRVKIKKEEMKMHTLVSPGFTDSMM